MRTASEIELDEGGSFSSQTNMTSGKDEHSFNHREVNTSAESHRTAKVTIEGQRFSMQ
jgi:hypothetical protein